MLKSTAIKLQQQVQLISEIRNGNQINKINHREELEFNREKLEKELEVKDRVDLSLKEYQELTKELEKVKSKLSCCENFISKLGKIIKTSPDILLKSKNIESNIIEDELSMDYILKVRFVIDRLEVSNDI